MLFQAAPVCLLLPACLPAKMPPAGAIGLATWPCHMACELCMLVLPRVWLVVDACTCLRRPASLLHAILPDCLLATLTCPTLTMSKLHLMSGHAHTYFYTHIMYLAPASNLHIFTWGWILEVSCKGHNCPGACP